MADTDSTKAPAFQFYPKDFLTDENVIVMSLQERGAYITLICICWQQGTLPADQDRLARLCGVPATAFRRLWPALQPCFRVDSTASDRLIHPRLERERQKQTEFKLRQSTRGKLGGRPRKPETTGNKAVAFTENTGLALATESSSSSSSSSSPDSSQERKERALPARTTSGVMAGMLPRDHLNCRPPCVRVCLSQKQHVILRGRHGGDETTADQALDAFYRDVRTRLPDDQPIGDRPWEFWDKQFAARFGTPAVSSKTAGNMAAVERFIARGKS